jgi:sugar lactone lactonase YvrE
MHSATRSRPWTARIRWAVPLLVLTVANTLAPPAGAQPAARPTGSVIVLPGATSAEGIAAGKGSTFYAGDLFTGDIFRGDVRAGTAELFIDAPQGRQAVGMAVSISHDLLFVAGGFTGQAYVYDTRTGETVAEYQFGAPGVALINDVAVTREGAWFTDSLQAQLYFVPIDSHGEPGAFSTLPLSGPAADTGDVFNLNGIQATANGKTLIVAHSGNGELYTVDPADGTSALIAGVSVPQVDGIVLRGHRLWAVQNINQVTEIRLSHDLTSGVVEQTITSALFQVPSTAALFGDTLAVVNAKFDTGIPPTADRYEVVLVRA